MNITRSIGILFSLFIFFAHSATKNQIAAIQLAAEKHVKDTVPQPENGMLSVKAAFIDQRIKATDCFEPLVTSSSSNSAHRSHINVLVSCPSDNWKVYVSVKLSLAIPMIVSTRPLSRGEVINHSDVKTQMVTLQRFRKEGFIAANSIVGAKVKRNISLGDVVERRDVCTVCRNEKVKITAAKSGMSISTMGTALQDGVPGDQVRVKNDKSERIIEGIVTGVSEITVTF